MGDTAIKAEGLSKRFFIGRRQESYKTLRDTLADAIASPFRKAGKLLRGQASGAAGLDEAIWGLKDVSFEIKMGEVVGIIGRNGAGKSTLLKVLSRITEPTAGYADIRGRVGSLLEVGTGFHPELTGRENIFLNGAILGMKRAEIHRKFEEIVEFAEVARFIDTPVKHYSSGMYLRLAFGVAAHLEPEILIVDEVLAVGDARFQKKCLNKMEDVGREGRTVLFVSHSMPAITRLCTRAILLDEGNLLKDGPSAQIVSSYLNSGSGTTAVREWPDPGKAPSGAIARLRAARVMTEDGSIAESIDIRRQFKIEMEYEVLSSGHVLLPHFGLRNEFDQTVFVTVDVDPKWRQRMRPKGLYVSTVWVPGNLLTEGTFYVGCYLLKLNPDEVQFSERSIVSFNVVDTHDGDSARGDYAKNIPGIVRPLLKWSTELCDLSFPAGRTSGIPGSDQKQSSSLNL